MLLTIRCTTPPVADLGYLLHKHPGKVQEFGLSFGSACVFYPELGENVCTVALHVEVDAVGLVRSRQGPGGEGGAMEKYVNDRPYAASSFLSVAIAEVFGSALGGRCKERPESVDKPLQLEVGLPVVSCRQGRDLLVRLFEPLGYNLDIRRLPLDPKSPEWPESRYYSVKLSGCLPLHVLLSHLYVLIPVADNNKHYWVGSDEVEKLLAKGKGWLPMHPEKELITQRYLRYQRTLVDSALEQLLGEEVNLENQDDSEESSEAALNHNEQRLGTVLSVLKASGAARVLDLGCGEGRLLKLLLPEKQFTEIIGMDVSHRSLEGAARHLRFDRLPDSERTRLKLLQGSLLYRDERLADFDAAAIVEVIEHMDPPRLRAFERVVFEITKPKTVVLTTPNRDYNVKWPSLTDGTLRHRDHRFEWSREEFQKWARETAARFQYGVRFLPVGLEDAEVGSPTQMGIFSRAT